MRSSTIFLIFGGILLAVVVLTALFNRQASSHPSVQVAQKFMRAVTQQDVPTLEAITDPATTKVMKAGATSLSGIHFTAVTPFRGAFARRPEVAYTYADLQRLEIDTATPPTIASDLATVPLKSGGKIYLKFKESVWTILYISKAEDESR